MNGNRQYRSMDFRSACGNGTCVEVALGEFVLVRDSKDPEGPVLVFTTAEWEEFLRGVKAGMFDIG